MRSLAKNLQHDEGDSAWAYRKIYMVISSFNKASANYILVRMVVLYSEITLLYLLHPVLKGLQLNLLLLALASLSSDSLRRRVGRRGTSRGRRWASGSRLSGLRHSGSQRRPPDDRSAGSSACPSSSHSEHKHDITSKCSALQRRV